MGPEPVSEAFSVGEMVRTEVWALSKEDVFVAERQRIWTVLDDSVVGEAVWERRVRGPGRVMFSCSVYRPGRIRIVEVVLSKGRERMADCIVWKMLVELVEFELELGSTKSVFAGQSVKGSGVGN